MATQNWPERMLRPTDTAAQIAEGDGWLAACHEAAHAVAAHYFSFPALGVSCHRTVEGNYRGKFQSDHVAFELATRWLADEPETLERLMISTCAVLRIGWVADLEIRHVNPHCEFESSWSDIEQMTSFLQNYPREQRAFYAIEGHRVALELVRRPWFAFTQASIAEQLCEHHEYILGSHFPLQSAELMQAWNDSLHSEHAAPLMSRLRMNLLLNGSENQEQNESAQRAMRYIVNLCDPARLN